MNVIPEHAGGTAGDYEIQRYKIILGCLILFLLWAIVFTARRGITEVAPILIAMGAALLFCGSCIVAGGMVAREEHSVVVRLSIGLIAYYFLSFVLGLLHFYSPMLLVLLASAPALALIRPTSLRQARIYLAGAAQFQRVERSVAFVAVLVASYSFLLAQAPVTHYDALTNHVAIPAEYLVRGGIETVPYNLHANLPPASHLIYIYLLAGTGAQAAQAFNFLIFLFVAAAFREISGKGSSGWLYGWILFALIPQVSLLLSLTSIDFLATFFCAVSFGLCFRKAGDRQYSFLIGMHMAFLFALKYQSVIFISLLFLTFAVSNPRRVLAAGLLVLALSIPVLWKNYNQTGNPIFPFAADRFTMPDDESREAVAFVAANSHMPDNAGVADYALTFLRSFTRLPEAGVLPVLLLFAALTFRSLSFDRKYQLALFAVAPVLLHSLLSLNVVNVMRWVQYAFAFLCLLAGIAFAEQIRRRWVVVAFALCVMTSFILAARLSYSSTQSILVGAGQLSASDYQTRFIPSFALRQEVTGLRGRVLFIGEPRAYYNVQNATIPSDYDFLYLAKYFDQAKDSKSLRSALQSDGIQYIFLNTKGITSQMRSTRFDWLRGEKMAWLQGLTAGSRVAGKDSISLIFDIR